MRLLQVSCVTVGLVCLISALYQSALIIMPRRSISSMSLMSSTSGEGDRSPLRLRIPALGLDLKIVTASLSGTRWPQTDEGVSHLTQSAIPGEPGNSVLYGHNWRSILGHLPRVRPGDEITVHFSDNSTLRFAVAYTQIVSASQTHILRDLGDTRLTVYTCFGFLDLDRFVVVATPLIPT